MFWWFQRGSEYLRYETRQYAVDDYELVILAPDGTERIEQFTEESALHERQVALEKELGTAGWTGPHGWHV